MRKKIENLRCILSNEEKTSFRNKIEQLPTNENVLKTLQVSAGQNVQAPRPEL